MNKLGTTMQDGNYAQRWRLSIGAVERDTGLSKDTLRVWEKRYGFPQPERDKFGERVYPQEQVEKLRLLKRLIDRGHRPGKLVSRSVTELLQLVDPQPARAIASGAATPTQPFAAFNTQDVAEIKQQLRDRLASEGLRDFVLQTVVDLHQQMSDAWMRGQLALYEERLYTEALLSTLQGGLGAIPLQNRTPRVLLGTFPNESRTLGLTMMECLLASEGASCLSLGAQAPVVDMMLAARAQQADIVALYFSATYPITQALEGLGALREQLPESAQVWIGSSNPAIMRRAPADVVALPRFDMIPEAVASWRQSQSVGAFSTH
ncbi:MAG TPA: MerR family transcriptional regulator [Burkholderiales bacterium]|nr:MerR family transcriptional regulator [Burkholderiales bacterium]